MATPEEGSSKKVFIIHGRSTKAADEMASFVRSLGLEPVIFGELRGRMGGTPAVAEIVTRGMEEARGVIALFTADEYAELRPELRRTKDSSKEVARWQARPNVLFEAGMAFGRDRNRVVFVLLGDVELFTDVAGIHYLRPDNDPSGDRDSLRRTLQSMGCDINDSSAWMKAGDFVSCVLSTTDTTSPFEIPQSDTEDVQVEIPVYSENDTKILLGQWLHELESQGGKRTLRWDEIDDQAQVQRGSARNLLSAILAEGEYPSWAIETAGDIVVTLRKLPLRIRDTRKDEW